jgi:hypothetical protein
MKNKILISFVSTLIITVSALAGNSKTSNMMDEFNPFDPNAEKILQEYDRIYQNETGKPAFELNNLFTVDVGPSCRQLQCNVYAQVVKSEQKLYLYVDGVLQNVWPVSTGASGHDTPLMNTAPNGRIYDSYSSSKYPGGDFDGLGNMPYAVFIQGGFAIHGTGRSNWPLLGTKASHGCVRLHPDNAKIFNRLVRSVGIQNTWVSVQD